MVFELLWGGTKQGSVFQANARSTLPVPQLPPRRVGRQHAHIALALGRHSASTRQPQLDELLQELDALLDAGLALARATFLHLEGYFGTSEVSVRSEDGHEDLEAAAVERVDLDGVSLEGEEAGHGVGDASQ